MWCLSSFGFQQDTEISDFSYKTFRLLGFTDFQNPLIPDSGLGIIFLILILNSKLVAAFEFACCLSPVALIEAGKTAKGVLRSDQLPRDLVSRQWHFFMFCVFYIFA